MHSKTIIGKETRQAEQEEGRVCKGTRGGVGCRYSLSASIFKVSQLINIWGEDKQGISGYLKDFR